MVSIPLRLPSRRSPALLVMLFSMIASASVGCTGKDPFNPGTKLGTFHVSAKLSKTTCGAAPDPWEFDVRLNYDGSTLYWIQGGVPIQGPIDTNARTEMTTEILQEIRAADSNTRRAACSVSRTDRLVVMLSGADSKPTSEPAALATFAGSLGYTFAPTEGSDCTDQLAPSGGDFDALPCEMQYELSGTRTSTPH